MLCLANTSVIDTIVEAMVKATAEAIVSSLTDKEWFSYAEYCPFIESLLVIYLADLYRPIRCYRDGTRW